MDIDVDSIMSKSLKIFQFCGTVCIISRNRKSGGGLSPCPKRESWISVLMFHHSINCCHPSEETVRLIWISGLWVRRRESTSWILCSSYSEPGLFLEESPSLIEYRGSVEFIRNSELASNPYNTRRNDIRSHSWANIRNEVHVRSYLFASVCRLVVYSEGEVIG